MSSDSDPKPPATVTHKSNLPCPRCHSKMDMTTTPSFSKMLNARCRKCAFYLDIETFRRAQKAEYHIPELEEGPSSAGGLNL